MLTKPPVPYDFCVADPISRFQLGEGPSRGLLRDYEPSDGPLFESLEEEGGEAHDTHYQDMERELEKKSIEGDDLRESSPAPATSAPQARAERGL